MAPFLGAYLEVGSADCETCDTCETSRRCALACGNSLTVGDWWDCGWTGTYGVVGIKRSINNKQNLYNQINIS
jgi:hypothetical protein